MFGAGAGQPSCDKSQRTLLESGPMAASRFSGGVADQETVNRDFVIWLAMDLRPFSDVNSPGFRYFFEKHVKRITIPDESRLRKKYLGDVYDTVAACVKKDLAEIEAYNIMFDGWTDKHTGSHFLGLRVQYTRDDWSARIATLSVKRCGLDSDSIFEHVTDELKQFIPKYKDNIVFSTHDGASVMQKVSRMLKVVEWQHCTAHALNLLLMTDSVSKVGDIMKVIRKCKEITNMLHFKGDLLLAEVKDTNNETATELLLQKVREIQQFDSSENFAYSENEDALNIDAFEIGGEEQGTSKDDVVNGELQQGEFGSFVVVVKRPMSSNFKRACRLKQEVPTRWNSCLTMMSSWLNMKKEVDNSLKTMGHYDKCLKSSEWSVVEELVGFLSHFQDFTYIVSEKVTSLSLIQLIRKEIQQGCSANERDCDELAALKVLVASNLDKRLPLSDSVKLATLLDPSTKCLLTETSRSENSNLLINAMQQYCANVLRPATATMEDDSCPQEQSDDHTSKRRRLLQKYRNASVPIDDLLRDEIDTYLGMQAEPEVDENPLLFWKTSRLENLKRLAKIILTRSASSVEVECMFSTMGIILNGKRSCLTADRADSLSFIHDNASFLQM